MIRNLILSIACCLALFGVGYGQKGETKPEWPGPDCIPEYRLPDPICVPGMKPADTITDDCKCKAMDDSKSDVTDECREKGEKCKRKPPCDPIDLLIGFRNKEW